MEITEARILVLPCLMLVGNDLSWRGVEDIVDPSP
jgi:hypothetical protein